MSNPLRFLFCSSDKFPPFRVDVDVLFGDEIASRGHKIDWVLQSEEACGKSYDTTWKNAAVYVSPNTNSRSRVERIKKHVNSFIGDFKIFSLARNNDYDFIQVKDKFLAALIGIMAAKIYGTRFFYWLSFPLPEAWLYALKTGAARYPLFYWIRGVVFKFLLYKVILRLADHVFVQSDQMRRDIAGEGISPEKMTPVPMGVKLEDFHDCSEEDNQCEDTNNVLYLGTMARVRRIDFVLRVFARVLTRIPDARLYMVGGSAHDEDMLFLKQVASELEIKDSVVFTDFLPRAQAMEFVEKANVCLSPFYPTPILNSTSPTKLIEYMAMCKPVVANDHPDQRMVLEDSEAGYCVSYDEVDFANAIVKLLEDKADARDKGRRGRRYVVENRSYQVLSKLVEEKYQELCSA